MKTLSLVTCIIVVSKVFTSAALPKVYVTVGAIPHFHLIVMDLGDATCGFWFVLVYFEW